MMQAETLEDHVRRATRNFTSPLPEDQVLSLLTAPQKEIWGQRRKRDHPIWGWTGFGLFQPVEDLTEVPEEKTEEKK